MEAIVESGGDPDISSEDPGEGSKRKKRWKEYDGLWELRKLQAFSALRMVSYKCFMRKMSKTIFFNSQFFQLSLMKIKQLSRITRWK